MYLYVCNYIKQRHLFHLAEDDFWGQVFWSATQCPCTTLHTLCEAKIGHLIQEKSRQKKYIPPSATGGQKRLLRGSNANCHVGNYSCLFWLHAHMYAPLWALYTNCHTCLRQQLPHPCSMGKFSGLRSHLYVSLLVYEQVLRFEVSVDQVQSM